MNIYSSKQKWKILLLVVAIALVGVSLFFSNKIVQGVSNRERERVKQWAEAIKKKAELVQLTNRTFSQLRDKERAEMEMWLAATREISRPIAGEWMPDYSFPLGIVNKNKDIPVILMDNFSNISGHINIELDLADFHEIYPSKSKKELQVMMDDSLRTLALEWAKDKKPFSIEVVEGLTMNYYYTDSKEIVRLERERDSLIRAFNNELIENERFVPIFLVNATRDSLIATNTDFQQLSGKKLKTQLASLSNFNEPLNIRLSPSVESWLYYDDSLEVKRLQDFPYIQFAIIFLFIFIGYLIFSTFRKAEQNQVWAGMAKETAHQLGTPLSSLMAWVELLRSQGVDENIVHEMDKDVQRLSTVTERFSKIGSETKLEVQDIVETVQGVLNYLKDRISSKVTISLKSENDAIVVAHNKPLFEWVIENVVKNAVDAMEGNGELHVELHCSVTNLYIDISDTGKGILPKDVKRIFQPGFTTKKRGWGLGLSLVKRIIHDYHKGKISVLKSEIDKGTTFRISLPR